MHRLSMAGVCLLIGLTASGCATLQSNRLACRLVAAGTGAAAGGLGVGLAVSQSGPPDDDRIAAVAGAAVGGAVVGAVVGLVIAHWACPPAEEAPEPADAGSGAPDEVAVDAEPSGDVVPATDEPSSEVVPAEPESSGEVVPAE